MRDSATVSPHGPDPAQPDRPTVYLTTRAGTVRHFHDAGQLADWLAEHPAFPDQDVLGRFLQALEGRRAARNSHPTVNDTLAMVVRINERTTR